MRTKNNNVFGHFSRRVPESGTDYNSINNKMFSEIFYGFVIVGIYFTAYYIYIIYIYIIYIYDIYNI